MCEPRLDERSELSAVLELSEVAGPGQQPGSILAERRPGVLELPLALRPR